MRRREFIALLSGAASGWPLVGFAQQSTKPVIGFLSTAERYPTLISEFLSVLAENGYYEGRNVFIEYRWAEGHYDRLPALAAELVGRGVDVRRLPLGPPELAAGAEPIGPIYGGMRPMNFCRKTETEYTVEMSR